MYNHKATGIASQLDRKMDLLLDPIPKVFIRAKRLVHVAGSLERRHLDIVGL